MHLTESSTAGGPVGRAERKRRGVWYTPPALVDLLVDRTITIEWIASHCGDGDRSLRVLDPACGDGRLLEAAGRRIGALGARATLTGADTDLRAVGELRRAMSSIEVLEVDALAHDWGERTFDLVIGNPPFLSQMATRTTRGGSSRHGGGPYADSAIEFLALAVRLVEPGGRVALILPQSVLASRDAAPVRAQVDRSTRPLWSWWSPQRHFDAEVVVCAIGVERRALADIDRRADAGPANWGHVVADALGIPRLPDDGDLATDGTVGDRAALNANFRDEYYALVPAVSDHADGPPLVTSGLIDPGVCHWGHRPVRFAKQRFEAPRVDLSRLDAKMCEWARRKLVPKVLVATQTSVIEAVADPRGEWLPGVPVTSVVPHSPTTVGDVAAVLTSPVASVAAWWRSAGTGLSATTIRLGPSLIASLPWPAGDLSRAVAALEAGDRIGCGTAVAGAYGITEDHPAVLWWIERVDHPRSRPGRRQTGERPQL